MAEISLLLTSIVPTFGVLGAGWLCRRIGIWDKNAVGVLNSYAYYIALPALIFQSLLASGIGSRFSVDDAKMIVGTTAAHLVVVILAYFFISRRRGFSPDLRATAPMLLIFGSTAYLGIPYATNTFGVAGASYASLLSVALVVSMLFISILILERYGRPVKRDAVWRRFIELPFIWSVAAGLVWTLGGLPPFPPFLSRTVEVLAGSAGPTALLALGAFQYGFDIRKRLRPSAVLLGAGKVILPGFLTFFILSALGLSGLRLAVGTAMASVSVAVTAFVLADQYRVGRETSAATLVFSSIFSFLALSTISWLWISTDVFK
ncbi:hypothetical protein A3D72_00400 [Candidatus Uhrbacteria bacterium RIFCSPHIGHO2_02_FULL_57_19]|uniref:Transporter n=1 Tax=Candidatus Uhrbacteria bacterium RIFCSPHIGHO2_02_FULL_57_19 TaxID=1802391 RepID=A0A1F7U6P1_9BACT|nr:MAG: hypothetical protein A3D72_00400 [Candidatus Uhrbacteria bacterium RIFCSPHIGHO2_02_FULL_57_19]